MTHSESNMQQGAVRWFRMQFPAYAKRLWAVPNAGKTSPITGAIFKREGCLPGVPDLFLSLPRGSWVGMFIEMKSEKGRVSPAQKEFIQEHHADYYCIVCYRIEDFIREVTTYLNLPKTQYQQ